MTPTGWRAWVPVAVSVAAILTALSSACWTRADTRRQAEDGEISEVRERVAAIEEYRRQHEPWSGKAYQEIKDEIAAFRGDLAGHRSLVIKAQLEAEAAKEASQTNTQLLLELLDKLRLAPANGHANGKTGG
jgi:hypothetical protein